jgi:RNA polymerase sigma-70 factor, ECF subfamily
VSTIISSILRGERRQRDECEAAEGKINPSEIVIYTASLRRYALALIGHSADADDLVQDCLKNVLVQIRNGRKIKDLKAYLFMTLNNLWRNEITRRRKRAFVSSDDLDPEPNCPADQDLRLECRDLDLSLRKLPEDHRSVVLLVGLEGYSYRSVAEMLGIPVGTVMSRLHRGREALRVMMSEQSADRVTRIK